MMLSSATDLLNSDLPTYGLQILRVMWVVLDSSTKLEFTQHPPVKYAARQHRSHLATIIYRDGECLWNALPA
jgi:hypothetical protein